MSVLLIFGFAIIALIYSSVGFGGGSTYTALLVFSGLDIFLVPIISLVCNLTVTSAGVWKSWRNDLFDRSGVFSILAFSVPAAFLGGITPISRETLILLLGGALLIAGLQLGWTTLTVKSPDTERKRTVPTWVAPIIGSGVGYLSGVVGIGGGIFLAPILHLVGWSSPRKIAALASAYIAANSLAGLAGKFLSIPPDVDKMVLLDFWPLIPAVIVGSFFGHRFMLGLFPERVVKGITAALILIVAMRLLVRSLTSA
ncbi:MAG: sulfoacetate transporter [Ponticaulis sp.]|nr:sulfoacetate transporter [Ponticaulis sp.]